EPSNYSFVVLVFSSLIILLNQYTKYKKLIGLTLLSMFLSFSTAAVFTAMLFGIYIFINQKFYKKPLLLLSLILLISFLSSTFYTLSQIQVDRLDSGAGNIRLELIKTISKRDLDTAILAYGAFGIE